MPNSIIGSVKDALSGLVDKATEEKDKEISLRDLYVKVDRLSNDLGTMKEILTNMNKVVKYDSDPSLLDLINLAEDKNKTTNPPLNPSFDPSAPLFDAEELNFKKGRESRKKKKERTSRCLSSSDDTSIERVDRNDRHKRKERFMRMKSRAEVDLVDDSHYIDHDMIYKEIKKLKIRVPFELTEKISLSTFLDQFPIEAFSHLSQQEYNSVLFYFLGSEIKSKLGEQGILPSRVTLKEYLGHLSNFKLGYNISDLDVLSELHNMKVRNLSLIQLFIAVTNLVDNVSVDIWNETIKCRHIFFFTKKYMPVPLKPIFDMLVVLNDSGKEIYPSRMKMKEFLIKNIKNSIDETNPYKKGILQVENKSKTSTCKNCFKGQHSSDYCFWHPDREVSNQNQIRAKLTKCLLCKDDSHLSISCDMYPLETPVYRHCEDCFAKFNVKAYHSSKICKGVVRNKKNSHSKN